MGWFLPITMERIVKEVVGYQVVETTVPLDFIGVVQPLKARAIELKPEYQRAWTWLWVHCLINEQLKIDDVVLYKGKQTRVMALKRYDDFGYMEYELCQDYTGAGPTVVEP